MNTRLRKLRNQVFSRPELELLLKAVVNEMMRLQKTIEEMKLKGDDPIAIKNLENQFMRYNALVQNKLKIETTTPKLE